MSRIVLGFLVVGLCLLPGCSDTSDAADVAAAPPADASQPRLHPLEEYCVSYVLEGMMQGTWEECGREHGAIRYELQNVEIKLGGFSKTENKRVVYRGDEIYTIRPDGGATRTRDTGYAARLKALENRDPKQVLDDFVAAMGYTLTGATKEIAGNTCQVASGPMGELCITSDALILHMSALGMTRRAVTVARGESGDPAHYAVPDDVAEGPDLSDIERMMRGARGN